MALRPILKRSLNRIHSMSKFKTKASWVYNPELHTEVVQDHVSLTVPDQTMSIKEIMDRHSRGLRIPDQMLSNKSFEMPTEDFDAPDLGAIGREDFQETIQFAREQKQKSHDLRQDIADFEKAADEKRAAEIEAAAEKVAAKRATQAQAKAGGQKPQSQSEE